MPLVFHHAREMEWLDQVLWDGLATPAMVQSRHRTRQFLHSNRRMDCRRQRDDGLLWIHRGLRTEMLCHSHS